MKSLLKEFFDGEKIEYFSVLPYQSANVTRQYIMARENFVPKSIIIFLVPYYAGETVNISRYAASRDYHLYLGEITEKLSKYLESQIEGIHSKGYGDHSPIDERDAAAKCSLGIIGKNGLLINEKYGSYIFIGELVCDVEPERFGEFCFSEPRYCDECGRCRAACPTAGLVDKTMPCLSAITQKRGELTDSEKTLMKNNGTVWGCDICQTVCPHNENPRITPIKFFHENRIVNLTPETFQEMSDDEFSTRAFSWRGRKVLERNIDIVKKTDPM